MPKVQEKLFFDLIDKGRLSGSGPLGGRYEGLIAFIQKLTEEETELYIELLISKRTKFSETVYYYVLALLFTYAVEANYGYLSLIIEYKIGTGEYPWSPNGDAGDFFVGYIELYTQQFIESISPVQLFRFSLFSKYKIKRLTADVIADNYVLKEATKSVFARRIMECYYSFSGAIKNNELINEFIESFNIAANEIYDLADFHEPNPVVRREHKNEMLFHYFIALNETRFDKLDLFFRNQMRLMLLTLIWVNATTSFRRKRFSDKEIRVLLSPMNTFKDGYYGDYCIEFITLQAGSGEPFNQIRDYLIAYIFAKNIGVRLVGFLESQEIREKRNSKTTEQIKQITFPDPYQNERPLDYVIWGTKQFSGKVIYYEKTLVYIEFKKISEFLLFSQSTVLGSYKTFWVGSEFYVQLCVRTEHLLTLMPMFAALFFLLATVLVAVAAAPIGMAARVAARIVAEEIAQSYIEKKMEEAGIQGGSALWIALALAELLHGRIKARMAEPLPSPDISQVRTPGVAAAKAEVQVGKKASLPGEAVAAETKAVDEVPTAPDLSVTGGKARGTRGSQPEIRDFKKGSAVTDDLPDNRAVAIDKKSIDTKGIKDGHPNALSRGTTANAGEVTGKGSPQLTPSRPKGSLSKLELEQAVTEQEYAEDAWEYLRKKGSDKDPKKALAQSEDQVVLSGGGYTHEHGVYPQRVMAATESEYQFYVRRYEELSGVKPPVRKALDYAQEGDYFATHAEIKERIVQIENGTNKPTGVVRDMCPNCRIWHQRVAVRQQQQIIVADPQFIRAFKVDGTVEIYTIDADFVKTVSAGEKPIATARYYDGIPW